MKRFLPAEFPLTGCDEFDLQCLNVVVGTRVSATQSSTYIAPANTAGRAFPRPRRGS